MTRHRRSLTGFVAALVVVLSAAASVGTGAAQAQASDPEPARLDLVRQTSWVGDQGVFEVVVDDADLPPGGTIQGILHGRVRTRAQLAAAIDAGELGSTIFTMSEAPIAERRTTEGVAVALRVTDAPDEVDEADLAPSGVYPFELVVRDADGTTVATLTTTLVRLGAAGSSTAVPLAVGVVVPVGSAATPDETGAPRLDEEAVGHLEATASVLADHPDLALTVTPSPESLELLAASGPDGVEAVEGLPGPARQLLARPFADIDLGAWDAAGLDPEAAEQYAAGARTVRSLLGTPPDGRTAVTDPTTTPEALDLLEQLGVTSLVVPSTQLDPLAGDDDGTFAQQFEVPTASGSTLRAVVGDAATSVRLLGRGDPELAGHDAMAELALLHLADPATARGVAVVVPSTTDPDALATLLAGLADRDGATSGSTGAPLVVPTSTDGLLATTSTAETINDGRTTTLVRGYRSTPPADLGDYPSRLRDARSELDGVRSIVPDDPALTDPIAETLLASGDRRLDPSQRTSMLDTATAAITGITQEIVVAPDQVVTLTSSSGKVPLNLENRLPVPARVRIVMNSDKLDFPEGSVIDQELAAATTTRIELPVETLASGAFPLDVAVISPDATLPVATSRYTVRSTAISGVGLVLSVGAGLFLLVWWARHFRTSRRAQKLVASNHPALTDAEPDGYAPPDHDPLEGGR